MEQKTIDQLKLEIENIKIDNNEMLLTAQKILESTTELIINTNKLTFKLKDIERDLKIRD